VAHAVHDVEDCKGAKNPEEQFWHPVAFSAAENFPAGHCSQAVAAPNALLLLKVATEQGVHAVLPSTAE
jgi:hypothetical protein